MNEQNKTASPPKFDQPLELLTACHARTLEHCGILEKLAEDLQAREPDSEMRSTAQMLLSYFSRSAILHHQDVEKDLFPPMRRQSLKLAELVHTLKQQREQLENLWTGIESDLKRIADMDRAAFLPKATQFCTQYRQHLKREDSEFIPFARSSLSSQQLVDVGMAMAERRGVRYPG